ncbi:MAG: LysR family transcriptional regulator [Desulfarculaceae bacterium]|nr:LysR family transcriptional regulator [Desulfarculaceae bacterium]
MTSLKAITYALALNEHRSFTAAARSLGISQSALSRAILKLESELGVPLFDRSRPEVAPTPHGEAYLGKASKIIGQLDEAEQEIRMMSGLENGTLRVGFGPVYVASLAGPAVGRFVADHPRVKVRISTGGWAGLSQKFLAGGMELYVGEISVLSSYEELRTIPLSTQSGVFFCRPDHPLLARAPVELAELAAFPFATVQLPQRITAFLDELLVVQKASHGMTVARPPIECENFFITKRVVAHSNAIGLTTGYVLREEFESGALRELKVKGNRLSSQGGVAVKSGATLSPAAQAFISYLVEADRSYGAA